MRRARFGDAVTNAGTKGLDGLVYRGPAMRYVPPGMFTMGMKKDEGADEDYPDVLRKQCQPRHRVRIETGFLLGRYPVTRGEYAVFARETKRDWPEPKCVQTDRHPAVEVSWKDADAYTRWLSDRTGRTFRLPSEVEWEYACRAGTDTARYWGEAFDGTRANSNGKGTTEVGSFEPNPWDFCDMLGNVEEWCADHWHDTYRNAPKNQTVWIEKDDPGLRVLRGGSWYYYPRFVRAGSRIWNYSDYRASWAGFRVARTL